ncbi:MAG: sigma factor [Polyangiales bacterium]
MSAAIEALVERTKAGDRAAAEALVAGVQDDVYRLAMRMLGMRAEAEDATQEILLQALTHLSEFRCESAFARGFGASPCATCSAPSEDGARRSRASR